MGLAIVAIPEEQDRVWKISSEKVPHLTLLFLGDAESADTQQIMQFVQHAVTLSEHGPFYLDVDRRGELGEANADVLFFSKRSWNLKWIKQFRGQLLQNGAIRSAYDSAEQFTAPQDWVPHLTLGYPETPAKKPDEDHDYPLYSVAFDRIAVWSGDYEGPEFRLEWPDRVDEIDGPLAVAWADAQKAKLMHYGFKPPETVEELSMEEDASTLGQGEAFVDGLVHGAASEGERFILEHYGVKGMRWGIRNEPGTVGLAGGSTGKAGSAPAGFKREAPVPVAPKADSKVPHGNRRKTKIKTDGGQNHPATKDALKVAEAQAKLKKSGPKALTNDELREVATRAQLESQAVQATRGGSNKFVREAVTQEGKQAVRQMIRSGIDKKIRNK